MDDTITTLRAMVAAHLAARRWHRLEAILAAAAVLAAAIWVLARTA